MVPDKFYTPIENKTVKHKSDGPEDKVNNDLGENDEIAPPGNEPVKSKKAASYAGGLVLEPKKVYMINIFYFWILTVSTLPLSRFVMSPPYFLNFNTFYHSLLSFSIFNQEYHICFTTVERFEDGLVPRLPYSKTTGT